MVMRTEGNHTIALEVPVQFPGGCEDVGMLEASAGVVWRHPQVRSSQQAGLSLAALLLFHLPV